MLRRLVATSSVAVAATAAVLSPSPAAAAAPRGDPWGPPHVLYNGRSADTIAQATTTDGTTGVVFQAKPRDGASTLLVAIRRSGEPWSDPVSLSDRRALRPKVVAWGAGQLSVIWQSPAGTDNYRFHLRSLNSDGTLGEPERLVKAMYAYPVYQAAMNSAGQVALAWSNGDLYDRVVLRQLDGSWTRYPKVPVLHPTCCGGLQYISNPQALFLDDAGRVSNITWGTVNDSDRAIWLTRPDADDGWTTQRIGPLDGGTTEYGSVPDATYASNPRGDLVVTWPQSTLGEWSVQLRFARNGHRLGEPTTLSHNHCGNHDSAPCAVVAMASDGTATVAYGRGERGDVAVEMVRRDPHGTFTLAQTLTAGLLWAQELQVAGNPEGDAIMSFASYPPSRSAFARCPATQPCAETLWLDRRPSSFDVWTSSMGADAEVTVTWSDFYHPGIATRQLAAVR